MEMNDEIVISGISGRFPECNNVEEFKEALLRGDNLVTKNEKRYPAGYKNFPEKTGTLPEIDKFDAVFFSMGPKEAKYASPRHRILLETVFEAIFDAGYNPNELRGTKTGVFVAMSMNPDNLEDSDDFSYFGHSAFQAANRISYSFDFKGPSYTMDTACSSSLYALSNAIASLKAGEIDFAVVSGASLNNNTQDAEQFVKLNLLTSACKVFSKDRAGFAMSETIVSYFLLRKSKSRRVYATVLGAKTNIDGFKKEGLNTPSSSTQSILMREVYEEAKISLDDFEYIEMHGTGTQVGDIVECKSILTAIDHRKKPLLVGSVKTNAGHTLHSSGLVGLTKAIVAMETGIIPHNLYIDNIDTTLPGIEDGKLQVVKTNTPYNGGIIGVNSFGIGGANAHVAVKPNDKCKSSCVSDRNHRLVQVSGRTEEAVNHLLDGIELNQNDEEFLSLIDEIHNTNVDGYYYRGYTVLGKTPKREITKFKTEKRPIWFIFSGMGSQWPGMGRDLMHFEVFYNTFNRCAQAVKPYGVDLKKIVMGGLVTDLDDVENCFSAIIAISVSLTDLLTSLGIEPDFIAGHSLGEIGCAYANGDITPEQAVLLAYSRSYACKQTILPPGQMAAIGMSKEAIKAVLPEDIYIGCQNSKDNVTITGPESSVKKFTEKLTTQGIFNKLVNTANIAFHSKYLMDADKYMLEFVQKVLTDPKPRINKWISTCIPSTKKEENWTKYNCPEYHVYNFKNTVLFDEVYQHIQKNAIIIEIAPHGLLRSILKREIGPENTLISLLNKTAEDQEEYLLSSIGQIFLSGVQPNLRKLYKEVSFPVSRGTKMLSPLVKWDHSTSYAVPKIKPEYFGKTKIINVSNKKYQFIKGHNVDGRVLMPGVAYLELVWSVLAESLLKKKEDLPVIFKNIKFLRSTVLPDNENIEFLVNIFRETGYFEIFEGRAVVCTGKITVPKDVTNDFIIKEIRTINNNMPIMNRTDFYKEFRLKTYNYKDHFQSISEISIDGQIAKMEWFNNFTCFLDGMLQILCLTENKFRDLMLPSAIKKIVIDPKAHLENASEKYYTVIHDSYLNVIKSKGIEIIDPKVSVGHLHQKTQTDPLLQTHQFVNYNSLNKNYDFDISLQIAVEIIIQNTSGLTKFLSIAEIRETEESNTVFEGILEKQILVEIDYSIVNTRKMKRKFDVIILSESVAEIHNIDIFINNLNQDGFIILCGKLKHSVNELDIIFQTPYINLLRLSHSFPISYDTINIRNSDFKWLEKLQNISKASEKKPIFLFSQNDKTSGILGLTKCLMTEDTKVDFKAVLIDQDASMFSVDDVFYREQLSKNLSINIFKNDHWGTYVHIPLGEIKEKVVNNAKISLKIRGNLSTLCWVEMPGFRSNNPKQGSEIVDIKYIALNFKDILLATGEINNKVIEPTDNDIEMCIEFAGVTKTGRRVLGIKYLEEFNTQFHKDGGIIWDVPSHWTLEEAATVPIVYATCYYALIMRGQMEEGNSILIHAGSGGVGIAAIRIALSLKAKIFTTVSSQEKKDFLLKMFPQLEEGNIGNSRDTSFYNLVKIKTKKRGVDIVLNCLADELFQQSLHLMAIGGKFIELGKKDLASGSHISSEIFLNNCSFHGSMLDKVFETDQTLLEKIIEHVKEGIDSGVVKPLPTTVFEKTQLESAWRYLATGKHKGKVLIKLSDENTPVTVSAVPRVKFDPEKVFIIIGGLGGMGIELTSWLLAKGARKVILNSRRDVWNGYQAFHIDKWQSFKNVVIKVDLNNTSNYEEADKLVTEAQKLGNVGGIFNTALVLKDCTIFNQTPSTFEEVFKPKVYSSENMDIITRKKCPHLDYFVVFSSVTAGRGNIGQTNYGMANAAMEKLCENRRRDNLPGLAVEWGPVGDVGALTNTDVKKKDVLNLEPQSINSCLNALEKFMIQDVIVGTSVVPNNKQMSKEIVTERTPANTVAQILGIENIAFVEGSMKLYEYGLDSLMVSEIKQSFYRYFQLEYDTESIREFSFDYLKSLQVNQPSNV